MSQENVEIVRRVYEAIDRSDAVAVLSLYDPDVEWDFTRSSWRPFAEQDVYRGHKDIRNFIRERYEVWETIEDELRELIDAGDEHVVSVLLTRGRGRVSGLRVEGIHAGVWTIRARKIVRVVWLPSRSAALEAVGLSE
jgi:ketosteroid isomerase-like protein